MKYICAWKNYVCATGYEYFNIGDKNSILGVHNPSKAATFTSQKAAREWIVSNMSFPQPSEVKVVSLDDHVKKWEAFCEGGTVYRKLQRRVEKYDRPYNSSKDDASTVLKWWIFVTLNENAVTYNNYSKWPKLYALYKCLMDTQLYRDYEASKMSLSFSMHVDHDTKFSDFKKELKLIDPHITFIEEGMKVLSVFDYKLSEGGDSVMFHYNLEQNKYTFERRWGSSVEFNDLEAAFEWWKRNRPYRRKSDNDFVNDDD